MLGYETAYVIPNTHMIVAVHITNVENTKEHDNAKISVGKGSKAADGFQFLSSLIAKTFDSSSNHYSGRIYVDCSSFFHTLSFAAPAKERFKPKYSA